MRNKLQHPDVLLNVSEQNNEICTKKIGLLSYILIYSLWSINLPFRKQERGYSLFIKYPAEQVPFL